MTVAVPTDTPAQAAPATQTATRPPKKTTRAPANVVDLPSHRYFLTEMGNADRFADQHRDVVIFCPAYGWMVYRAGKWCRDCEHLVRSRAQKTIRSMQREAGQLEMAASKIADAEKRAALAAEAETLRKWARHSETDHMVKAMLALAAPNLTVDASVFDADPWLLNAKNGTLDMRTGKLHPHRRDDYLMKQCGVAYEPNTTAPTFAAWIDQVMLSDQQLVTYLQQLLGYSLTGDTAEQKWFLFKGGGANGKSTLAGILQHILADYAVELSPDTITVSSFTRGGAEPAPDIVRLAGARVAIASETEQGARLKSALLKRLTGGNTPITARDLYRSPFEFLPQFKLLVDTNHMPQVRDRSFAFWRRVRIIPFDYKIPDDKRDATIEDRLQAEGAGILAWLVQGLRAYLAAGRRLPACAAVERTTQQYQADQDIIGVFLREKCVRDRHAEQPSQELYNAFSEWVEQEMGERPMAQRSFTQALEELGYTSRRVTMGMRWVGIRLRTVADPDPDDDPEPTGTTDETEPAGTPDHGGPAPVVSAAPGTELYGDLLSVLPERVASVPAVVRAVQSYHERGRPVVELLPPGQTAAQIRGVALMEHITYLIGRGGALASYGYTVLNGLDASEQEAS